MHKTSTRRRPAVERVEREHGKPFAQVVAELAAEGLSKIAAADRIGMNRTRFAYWTKRLPVQWRFRDGLRSPEGARLLGQEVIRQRLQRDDATWVEIDGERVTLKEASRRTGIGYSCLCRRYQRGLRGADLLRKPKRRWKVPSIYHLDITAHDAQLVLEMVSEVGAKRTASKLGLPYGAITALMRGEWERVA